MDYKKYIRDSLSDNHFNRLHVLCDGYLLTEDGSEFGIHKIILALQSNYFQALFCFGNGLRKYILIPGIDGRTLNNVLSYIYTGSVHLCDENIREMLVASDYLLIEPLLKECRIFAVHKMTVTNCLPLFITAWENENLGILNNCYRFIQTHFECILRHPKSDISKLPFEALKKLLGDKSLNVSTERTVWLTIILWVEKKIPERLLHVPELLKQISLKDMDEALLNKIALHPIVRNNPAFEHSSKNEETHFSELKSFLLSLNGPRIPLYLNLIIYHCAFDFRDNIQIFLTYDDKLDIWRKISEAAFYPDIIIPCRQYVYLFNTWENSCIIFDIIDKSWTMPNSMNITRYEYSVVKLEDCVYSLGGWTEDNLPTNSVEYYDPDTNIWVEVNPMHPMNSYVAVSLNGQIYVFGDISDDEDLIMGAQVYNSHSDEWNTITPPKVLREDFAAVVYEGYIYLIGGHNNINALFNVEMYDPVKDTWLDFPSLPFPYFMPKAIVWQKTLLVFDNHLDDRKYYKTSPPLLWDMNECSWQVISTPSPMNELHLYHFCEVFMYLEFVYFCVVFMPVYI
ncbi:Kelch-like protein 10, partial [Stegodyphus mimosarum]